MIHQQEHWRQLLKTTVVAKLIEFTTLAFFPLQCLTCTTPSCLPSIHLLSNQVSHKCIK